MYYEIYLDFYFLENLFTDCTMLILTAVLMKETWKRKRIFLAGLVESTISCIWLLFPVKYPAVIWSCQIFDVFLMIRIGFGKKHWKDMISGMMLFYLGSFSFAGAVSAMEQILKIPLFILKAVMFLVLWSLLQLYIREKGRRERICEAEIFWRGKSRKVKALYDTGNSLQDPYKKRPVNIIEYDAVKELLTGEEKLFLIPYRTVSGSGNLFQAMIFERMQVGKGKETKIYEHPVMALAKEKLSSDDSYQMILHPDNRKNQEEKNYV